MGELLKKKVPEAGVTLCEWPGCNGAGEFRAPRSRNALTDYRWFCLDHVREYNRNWNYYQGMDEGEVEADIRRDTVWHRPTWRLGSGDSFKIANARLSDPLGIGDIARDAEVRAQMPKIDPRMAKALAVFGLDAPVTVDEVKARYKELVKRHHPDANGGTKAAEEEFKKVSEAYTALMDFLAP